MGVLAFPGWDPILFSIGAIDIRWYGLLYVASYFAAYLLIVHLARRGFVRANPDSIDSFIYWIAGCGVLGARLVYVVFYNPTMLADPLSVFKIWEGGLASHGGLLGSFVGLTIYSRLHRVSWWRLTDCVALATFPNVLGVRLANFINGELYGRITDASVPWAMRFPTDPVAAHMLGMPDGLTSGQKERLIQTAYDTGVWQQIVEHVPLRHPSQLYEALGEGVILGLAIWILYWKTRHRRLGTGVYAGLLMLSYGIVRFFLEFFRQPDAQFATDGQAVGSALLGLSMGQLLCLVMLVIGTTFVVTRWKQRVPDQDWTPPEPGPAEGTA